MIVNDDYIVCRCHGSCAFATINNNDESCTSSTQCGARSSCQQCESCEESATNAGHIYGYLGLAWTKHVNITDVNLICFGEASCFNLGTA